MDGRLGPLGDHRAGCGGHSQNEGAYRNGQQDHVLAWVAAPRAISATRREPGREVRVSPLPPAADTPACCPGMLVWSCTLAGWLRWRWELQPSGALWWRCRHSASYSQPRFQTCPCPRAACRLPSGLHAARSNPRHDSCCCLAPPRAFPQPVVPTQAVWVVIVIVRFTGMFRPPPNAPWRVLHDSRTPRSRGSRVPWPQRRRRRRLCSGPVDGAGTLAGKGATGACCPV